jgi:lipid A disaccharide synthetase
LLVRYALMKVKYITLVNLLAVADPFGAPQPYERGNPECDALPFPEYATYEDRSAQLAEHAREWLTDEAARERKVAQLRELKERYARAGASQRAATIILEQLAAVRPLPRAA